MIRYFQNLLSLICKERPLISNIDLQDLQSSNTSSSNYLIIINK